MKKPVINQGMRAKILLLMTLASCGPSTLEDLRCEGEAETRKLARELHAIETKEELQKAVPKLKKRFNKIAEILVETRAFPKEERDPSFASEELFADLARLYEMPGGRELIESAQVEAVQRLKH
jgi:nitric oxide reductase activation protein